MGRAVDRVRRRREGDRASRIAEDLFPPARDAFNAVLAVEQAMGTGGGGGGPDRRRVRGRAGDRLRSRAAGGGGGSAAAAAAFAPGLAVVRGAGTLVFRPARRRRMCRGAWRACSRASAAAARASLSPSWTRGSAAAPGRRRRGARAALGRAMAEGARRARGVRGGRGGVGVDAAPTRIPKTRIVVRGSLFLIRSRGAGAEEARGGSSSAGALEKHAALQAKTDEFRPRVWRGYTPLPPRPAPSGATSACAGNGGHARDQTRCHAGRRGRGGGEVRGGAVRHRVRVQMINGGDYEEEGEGGRRTGWGAGHGARLQGGEIMWRGRRMTPKRRTPPRNARGIPPRGGQGEAAGGAGRGRGRR